jgi:hypothetical protein
VPHKIPMIGKKYGRLTVREEADRSNGVIRYSCECDCGNTTIASGSDLRFKRRTTCGCRNNTPQVQALLDDYRGLPLTARDIAEELNMQPSTARTIAHKLVQAGHARAWQDPNHQNGNGPLLFASTTHA